MMSKTSLTVVLALLPAPVFAVDISEELALGVKSYKDFCAKCHGPDMVNPGTSSYDLRKWSPDNKAGFVDSVVNGKGDMPAWGDVLYPEEIEALWRYVATRGGTEPFPDTDSGS